MSKQIIVEQRERIKRIVNGLLFDVDMSSSKSEWNLPAAETVLRIEGEISQAVSAERKRLLEGLPKERVGVKQVFDLGSKTHEQTILSDQNLGFNECLDAVKLIIGEKPHE